LSFNQGQVASASHIFILCVENNVDTAFIKNYFDLVEKTRTTPREQLRSFEEFLIDDFSKKTSEEIKSWATNQAYLAIGNLLTVCAIEKVDACPIEGFAPDKYDAYFNLSEKGLSAVLVMAVGHRAKDDVFSEFKKVRRGVDALVIEIE
jgi:nitroreductase